MVDAFGLRQQVRRGVFQPLRIDAEPVLHPAERELRSPRPVRVGVLVGREPTPAEDLWVVDRFERGDGKDRVAKEPSALEPDVAELRLDGQHADDRTTPNAELQM